ncbi:hypothetical protein ACFS4T_04475 [Pseudomonas lini]
METRSFSAAERLERLPISGYHRIIFHHHCPGVFFFDSMDLAMMTFLLGSIKTEFGLSTAQAGLLASSSFFGMVLGGHRCPVCWPTASGANQCSSGALCCGASPATCAPRRRTSKR